MADLDFAYDLTLDEARRRTAVLEAIGDDWDPIAVLANAIRVSAKTTTASRTVVYQSIISLMRGVLNTT